MDENDTVDNKSDIDESEYDTINLEEKINSIYNTICENWCKTKLFSRRGESCKNRCLDNDRLKKTLFYQVLKRLKKIPFVVIFSCNIGINNENNWIAFLKNTKTIINNPNELINTDNGNIVTGKSIN